jgi:hypothetical protein
LNFRLQFAGDVSHIGVAQGVSGSSLEAGRSGAGMSATPNKRAFLRPILDRIEEGWEIRKPAAAEPFDPDYVCIFIHPSTGREARTAIPTNWFRDSGLFPEIELAVRMAVRNSVAPTGPGKI